MIGFAMCGSYCTHRKSISTLRKLSENYDILPITSENVYTTDTKFGNAKDLVSDLETICKRKVIHTIKDAEPIGPMINLEFLIICPCTGNTLAKIASGITDTAVTMAAKAHLRKDRPLLIALATNDALCSNLPNIGTLLNRKNIYFTPMLQDDPTNKPHSLVADFEQVIESTEALKRGEQIRPLFIS